MPFYEYQCAKCGHEEEVLQKVSDKPLKKCPACGKSALQKKVSAAAFRLKGGGWYETDFKSGNKKNVAADGKTEKKSESKDMKQSVSSNTAAANKSAATTTTTKKARN